MFSRVSLAPLRDDHGIRRTAAGILVFGLFERGPDGQRPRRQARPGATGGDVVYRGRRRGRRAAGGHGDVRPAHSRDRRLPLECAKQSLSNHDVTPDSHVNLAAEGVPKKYHTDYDDELAEELFEELVREVDRAAASV